MNRIAGILILGLMVSCHTPKKTANEQPKTETGKETPNTAEQANEMYYLGEVQLLDCGVIIEVSTGAPGAEKKYKFSPTNLDPKLQVDKLRLKLKFKALDERGTGCSEFKAIEIKEAFAVR